MFIQRIVISKLKMEICSMFNLKVKKKRHWFLILLYHDFYICSIITDKGPWSIYLSIYLSVRLSVSFWVPNTITQDVRRKLTQWLSLMHFCYPLKWLHTWCFNPKNLNPPYQRSRIVCTNFGQILRYEGRRIDYRQQSNSFVELSI